MGILEDIFGPHTVVGTGPPIPAPPPPPDTDGDGLSDDTEWNETGTNPADADDDNDGLTDYEEYQLGTDGTDADTDDDGLTDWQESQQYGTDPLHWDTDRDGLGDGKEASYGTDAFNPDTDRDGLLDGQEAKLRTDPTDADTDDDGLRDGFEVNILHSSPKNADTDYDGRSDRLEYQEGTDPGKNDFVDIRSKVGDHELYTTRDDGDDDDPWKGLVEQHGGLQGGAEGHIDGMVTEHADMIELDDVAGTPGNAAFQLEVDPGVGFGDITSPAIAEAAPDFGAGAGGEDLAFEPPLTPATPPGVPIPYPNAEAPVDDLADALEPEPAIDAEPGGAETWGIAIENQPLDDPTVIDDGADQTDASPQLDVDDGTGLADMADMQDPDGFDDIALQ